MRGIFVGVVLVVELGSQAFSQVPCPAIDLPRHEISIIAEVADQYGLEGDARLLLFVIRKIENGRPGREFGILTPEAMRYTDGVKSFKVQASWAAGTIKKRFSGDLAKFANRYCPVGAKNDPSGLNNHWYKNARYYMSKWRAEI